MECQIEDTTIAKTDEQVEIGISEGDEDIMPQINEIVDKPDVDAGVLTKLVSERVGTTHFEVGSNCRRNAHQKGEGLCQNAKVFPEFHFDPG